jgi:hypothetical protein
VNLNLLSLFLYNQPRLFSNYVFFMDLIGNSFHPFFYHLNSYLSHLILLNLFFLGICEDFTTVSVRIAGTAISTDTVAIFCCFLLLSDSDLLSFQVEDLVSNVIPLSIKLIFSFFISQALSILKGLMLYI